MESWSWQIANRKSAPTSFLQLSLNVPNLRCVNDSLSGCAAKACKQPNLCPLNRVKAGTAVRIKQLSASAEISQRLRELGFCEERQIKLVSRHVNLICQVCNARLGISRKLAEAILVEPILLAGELQVA